MGKPPRAPASSSSFAFCLPRALAIAAATAAQICSAAPLPLRPWYSSAVKLDNEMASARGGWEGSEVVEYNILRLRRAHKMPEETVFRVPGGEVVQAPQPGERVVFTAHFPRGFALPVSGFFRQFLDHFGLQPHHLGPNTIMLLSAFVTLCDGYLGVRPTVPLWTRLCHFRSQMVATGKVLSSTAGPVPEKVMTACGAASIYANSNTGYPSLKPRQSMKK